MNIYFRVIVEFFLAHYWEIYFLAMGVVVGILSSGLYFFRRGFNEGQEKGKKSGRGIITDSHFLPCARSYETIGAFDAMSLFLPGECEAEKKFIVVLCDSIGDAWLTFMPTVPPRTFYLTKERLKIPQPREFRPITIAG